MEDASALERELEQELLLESEQEEQVSTPRQRLEDARAMDDSNCGSVSALVAVGKERGTDGYISYPSVGELSTPEEEEEDTSSHLLQVRCGASPQLLRVLYLKTFLVFGNKTEKKTA